MWDSEADGTGAGVPGSAVAPGAGVPGSAVAPGAEGPGSSAAPGHRKIAVFGGVYSNYLALDAAIEDARLRGARELYCLGDLGAFGPHPDRVFPRLIERDVATIRGNYDDSISRGLDDCRCGYTDPRDNHFARLSYRYTFRNTSPRWKRWMGELPAERRAQLAGQELLMCHGSPRRMNEFLWESTTSTPFLGWLADEFEADILLFTHTGIPWARRLPGGRLAVNVGALGRPANDGSTDVWYALLSAAGPGAAYPVDAELVPVSYDHQRLATEMRREELPEEFAETILTGWWTTCLEVLPARERARGRY